MKNPDPRILSEEDMRFASMGWEEAKHPRGEHGKFKVGDTVKFVKPESDREAKAKFRIVEHNGDRAVVEHIGSTLPIPSHETVHVRHIRHARNDE